MKKILTLAIALVMVFAIAAPAFASGWDIDPEPAKELKDITLAIDALTLERTPPLAGMMALAKLTPSWRRPTPSSLAPRFTLSSP